MDKWHIYYEMFRAVFLIIIPATVSFVLFSITFYYRCKPSDETVISENRKNRKSYFGKAYIIVMAICSITDLPLYFISFFSSIERIKLSEQFTKNDNNYLTLDEFDYYKNYESDYLIENVAQFLERSSNSVIKMKLVILVYILRHSFTLFEFYLFDLKFRKKVCTQFVFKY